NFLEAQMRFTAPFRACALALLLACTVGQSPAAATTLFNLIGPPGGSITVGSLMFSNFSYLSTGDMPNSLNVNVIPYTDPISGDVGLKFQGAFLDFPGSSGGSAALIDFPVTGLDPTKLVTAVTLAGNPAVVPLGPTANGVASVTETFLPTDPS